VGAHCLADLSQRSEASYTRSQNETVRDAYLLGVVETESPELRGVPVRALGPAEQSPADGAYELASCEDAKDGEVVVETVFNALGLVVGAFEMCLSVLLNTGLVSKALHLL